jgi:hypothetical protein
MERCDRAKVQRMQRCHAHLPTRSGRRARRAGRRTRHGSRTCRPTPAARVCVQVHACVWLCVYARARARVCVCVCVRECVRVCARAKVCCVFVLASRAPHGSWTARMLTTWGAHSSHSQWYSEYSRAALRVLTRVLRVLTRGAPSTHTGAPSTHTGAPSTHVRFVERSSWLPRSSTMRWPYFSRSARSITTT